MLSYHHLIIKDWFSWDLITGRVYFFISWPNNFDSFNLWEHLPPKHYLHCPPFLITMKRKSKSTSDRTNSNQTAILRIIHATKIKHMGALIACVLRNFCLVLWILVPQLPKILTIIWSTLDVKDGGIIDQHRASSAFCFCIHKGLYNRYPFEISSYI